MTDDSSFELTRRDAAAALAAAGVLGGGGAFVLSVDDTPEDDEAEPTTEADGDETAQEATLGDHERETLVAIAEVLYPSAVENVGEFVTAYTRGRVEDDPDRVAAITDTVSYLDEYVDTWYEPETYLSLSRDRRSEVFERAGVDTATPDPDGGNVERVRYYLLNDLLFALYASPTGGELVGIENPQGYPGGASSYRRGPEN